MNPHSTSPAMALPARLTSFLDNHFLPIVAGALVNIVIWAYSQYPVAAQFLSEGQAIGLLMFLLTWLASTMDLTWSNDNYFVHAE